MSRSIKQQLIKQVKEIVEDLGISDIQVQIEASSDPAHGDYSTNIALLIAKKLGKNPREVAEEIAEKIRNGKSGLGVEKVEVAGPGFINFWLKDKELLNSIDSLRNNNTIFDTVKSDLTGKKVIVEYSSPNIAKPFTVGHLRSTIIGDAIANLLDAVGYTVFRDNHIGDWGTQFGKQIAALKFIDYKTKDLVKDHIGTNLNDLENLKSNIKLIDSSNRPVKLLVEFYVLFHELEEKYASLEDLARAEFKELELSREWQEDQEYSNRWIWKKCIEWSWKEFNEIYEQLGVSFTENHGRGYGEAFFENRMVFILDELKKKPFYKEGKEGAKIVEFPKESKFPPLMILKKDGATLYSTRDLATDRFRLFEYKEYGRDVLIINEVGIEQELYFKQLYKLEEMLGWVKPGQRVHVKHGHYRFKEGKMSTRKGNVIWLEDVLREAKERASKLQNIEFPMQREQIKDFGGNVIVKKHGAAGKTKIKTAEVFDIIDAVAIGALKWNDLKRDSKQDITFDWDEILNMQGNSGPYLQYTYARTQSVLRKSEEREVRNEKFAIEPEERELLRLLSQFSDVVAEAANRYAPHLLCTYLFDLAQAFNLFYQKLPILKADEKNIRDFRLNLTEKTGIVLKQGLALLGIKAPDRM